MAFADSHTSYNPTSSLEFFTGPRMVEHMPQTAYDWAKTYNIHPFYLDVMKPLIFWTNEEEEDKRFNIIRPVSVDHIGTLTIFNLNTSKPQYVHTPKEIYKMFNMNPFPLWNKT
jgi:hypothetical protein